MGIDEDAIVFVEDSDIDLGLLTAVERNIERFFEWMADFLNWHLGMVEAPVDEAIAKLEESIRKMKLRIERGGSAELQSCACTQIFVYLFKH